MRARYALAFVFLIPCVGAAEVFEVEEGEVERGEIELEVLNAVGLEGVSAGDERSSHEISVGYGVTDFWKATFSLELENEEDGALAVDGFEFENVFALIGVDDDDDGGAEETGLSALALYAALEIPEDEGFDEAELALGPIVGLGLGDAEFTGNLFLQIPFESGEDPGLAYAMSLVAEISDDLGVGVEAHGEVEEAFGGGGEHALFVGPALYGEIATGEAEVGARLALLFGLDEAETGIALSFNVEIEF